LSESVERAQHPLSLLDNDHDELHIWFRNIRARSGFVTATTVRDMLFEAARLRSLLGGGRNILNSKLTAIAAQEMIKTPFVRPIQLHEMESESVNDSRLPVDPTRIGEIGVGSFLILTGGILCLFSCFLGAAFLEGPARLQVPLVATAIYGILISFLANAKRRSKWAVPDEVS